MAKTSAQNGGPGLSEFDEFSARYRELLDENIKKSGESNEYFSAYKARLVATKVDARENCRILDYGCGIGLVSSQLKRLLPSARIDGYDVSQESLDHVDATLKTQGVFTSEPRELGRDYDLVIMANVLHHIDPSSRQDTVRKASDVLKPQGILMTVEHNPANPLTRRAVESCAFDQNAVLLSPGEARHYYSHDGFQNIRVQYIVFFPHFLRWLRALEPSLGWCFWGAQYVVTGVRP